MTRLSNGIQRRKAITISLVLLILAIVFLRPALFPPAGQALGTHDAGGLFGSWFKILRESISAGQIPLWDPYQFVGYPFLSNPQVGFFYPPAWLAFILPANAAISWYVLIHLWLSAVGMLLFARSMGGGWTGSMLAAASYGFSGFIAARLWAGHIGMVATFAWLPWVILALQWSIRRGDIWPAIVAGLPVGLAILAGHTPSFLTIGFIWLAFFIYDLIQAERRRLAIRQAMIMLLTGLGLAAVQLLPFVQLSLVSQQVSAGDLDFAAGFSLPPVHLITLLLPEFFGEPTQVGYWSVPTFEELTYYTGLAAVLGIVLGLRKPTRLTWFYISLIILGLGMALGSYGGLYRLAYDVAPISQFLQAPARWAVVAVFASAALLAHALSTWLAIPRAERVSEVKPLLISTLLVVIGAGILAIGATGAVFMALRPTDTSGRMWQQIGGYGAAVAILVLAIGLIWGLFSATDEQRRRRLVLAAGLLLLITADLWHFGAKLVALDVMEPNQLWQDAKAVIGESDELVLPWGVSIADQNGSTEVGLRSAFGYQALEPRAMVAFTSHVADPRSSAYDILGARYVVAPVELGQFTEGDGALDLIGQQGAAWVYSRPNVLPVARLAQQVEVIADDAQAIARVHHPDFERASTVILNREPTCTPAEGGTATIDLSRPGYWRIVTESAGSSMLVLAESDFAGWQAAVDGEPASTYRAFTTVRAVCVPAGQHIVEWEYKPRVFVVGGVISMATALVVLVAVIMLLRTRLGPAGPAGQAASEQNDLSA